MKTKSKLSAYILRGSTTALLFSCVLVALCWAINLPEQGPRALPPQDNAAFGANANQSRILSFAERVAPLSPIGPRWEIVNSPNNGFGTNKFYATTCVSASNCWAVGYSDNGNGYTTLIERWNGAIWNIVSSPNNSGNNILYGVTCTSTSDCWAVGTYWDQDGLFQRTLIEHWNGAVWNIVSSPNRALSTPPIDVLVGVACISTSECWAAGSYDDREGVGQTLIERWDGISWTIVDSPNPSGSNSLDAVTCAWRSQTEVCWAVGESVTGLGGVQTLIEKWDGGAWSIVSSPNSGGYNDLRGVTCASKQNCWAVGSYSDGGPNQTLIEHWNGILWTILSSPNTSTMQNNYLSAVACASASNCWAVGYYGGNGAFQTLAEQWDGNIWTIVSSPNPSGAHDSEFLGVTCASVEQCWAAGFYVTNGPPRTLVEMWQGPTPRPTPTPRLRPSAVPRP